MPPPTTPPASDPTLSPDLAAQLATRALANVGTEYPFHLLHLANDAREIAPPRALHPLFFGSYDWHSCVHMHWSLLRCLRRFPDLPLAAAIAAHFDARLTPAAVAGECAYFSAAGRASFERPYGWAWLLALDAELQRTARAVPAAAGWRAALVPLVNLIATRFANWLPRAAWPVRSGAHANSAFALQLALDWARVAGNAPLAAAIGAQALRWYGDDRHYPAAYEPSGEDFLSAGLCEARLMRHVLDDDAFARWWQAFAPDTDSLARWLDIVDVTDATDARIVHLHGLNLSRAWCWRSLQRSLPPPLPDLARRSAAQQLAYSLPAALAGDYVGTHWLASFALLALDGLG
jgi:hypothetical protein